MRAWVIVLGLLGFGLVVFAWRKSMAVPNSRPLDATALSAGNSAADGQHARSTGRPQLIRSEAVLPAGAASAKPGPPIPIEDRLPGVADDPEFAAKYKGWSTEKLEQRLEVLESTHQAEVEKLCDARFQAGMYRVGDETEMEGLDDSYDVLSPFNSQGVVTRSRTVALETAGQTLPTEEESEPQVEYQICTLPPEIYPELYRQIAELEWLRATVAARALLGEDSK